MGPKSIDFLLFPIDMKYISDILPIAKNLDLLVDFSDVPPVTPNAIVRKTSDGAKAQDVIAAPARNPPKEASTLGEIRSTK